MHRQRLRGEKPVIHPLKNQPAVDRIDPPGNLLMGITRGVVGADKRRAQGAPHKPLEGLPVSLDTPGSAPDFAGTHNAQFTGMGQQLDIGKGFFDIGQQVPDQFHAAAFIFGQLGKQGFLIRRVARHILEYRAVPGSDIQGQCAVLRRIAQKLCNPDCLFQRLRVHEVLEQ